MARKAKLITCSYPTTNPQRAAEFYGALLGVELARSLTEMVSYHALVSAGVQLTLNQRAGEHAICHFAVDDLNATIQELTQLGGSLVAGPFELQQATQTLEVFKANYALLREAFPRAAAFPAQVTPSMGICAIMRDPDGNDLGLIQLASYAHIMFQKGDLDERDEKEHQIALGIGSHLG